MQKVKELFEQLQTTSSKLEKQRIIKDNADNQQFKDTLVFLLNPFVLTGISEKKINKKVSLEMFNNIEDWQGMKDYLKTHDTGSDAVIFSVQRFIANQPDDMKGFYKGLITKSIKLGCDAKIVNDVIPGLVPSFDVQLGTSVEKCKLEDGKWFSLSRKLNGNRCVYVNGILTSRQGKVFTGLDHIIADIQKLNMPDIVFDGELVGKNENGLSDSENFQVSTGIANSKDKDKSSLKLVIFDTLPEIEFERGKSTDTYKTRKAALIELKTQIAKLNLQNIEIVEMLYEGTDTSQIWTWLDKVEAIDYEGLMLNYDTPYVCKRTKDLIKIKKFFDIDLRCVSANTATTGKYRGNLGSITCKFKGGFVDVGSGFSDEQRTYYYTHPEEIMDKIVTVKYKEITKNKNGGESLQFPVFVTVRQDKSVPDDE